VISKYHEDGLSIIDTIPTKNFEGGHMNYIAIDAHSSTCTMCVLDSKGCEKDSSQIETNGRLIKNYLRSFTGKKIVTFEESELSSWLFDIIRPEAEEVLVCNPVAIKDYTKKKTDKLDSRKLARLLRGGFLVPVYHDGSKREKFRHLISGYNALVEDAVRMKNRYKSIFRKSGNKQTGTKIYNDGSLLEDISDAGHKFVGHHLYTLLVEMEKSREAYVREIKTQLKGFEEIKYIKSIPGLGDIQTAKIIANVVDPRRFANKHKFYSYCGLVRHQRISDGTKYGSNKIFGNRTLKCVYKMAGYSAINGNNVLNQYHAYLIKNGVNERNAYNAVCRKIAAISLAVWKNKKYFNDEEILKLIK